MSHVPNSEIYDVVSIEYNYSEQSIVKQEQQRTFHSQDVLVGVNVRTSRQTVASVTDFVRHI